MKRYMILLVIILAALLVVGPVFAERKGEGAGQGKGRKTERVEKATDEEVEEAEDLEAAGPRLHRPRRGEMRHPGPPSWGQGGEMEAGRRQPDTFLKSIEQEITNLKDKQGQFIAELKAIHQLAVQEKATKTAERLKRLIEKRQKKFEKDLQGLKQRRERLKNMLERRTLGRGAEVRNRERFRREGEKGEPQHRRPGQP